MVLDAAAMDTLFYLHYRNIDRIWAFWQAQNQRNAKDYSGWFHNQNRGATIKDTIQFATTTYPNRFIVEDLMSTTSGIWLCYRYSNPIVAPSLMERTGQWIKRK